LEGKSTLRLTFNIICCTHAEVALLYYWRHSCCRFLHPTSHSHASDGLCPQITVLDHQLACAVLREAAASTSGRLVFSPLWWSCSARATWLRWNYWQCGRVFVWISRQKIDH